MSYHVAASITCDGCGVARVEYACQAAHKNDGYRALWMACQLARQKGWRRFRPRKKPRRHQQICPNCCLMIPEARAQFVSDKMREKEHLNLI